MSDEEWDAMKEEKLRRQAERDSQANKVPNESGESGQSDYYSGIDYQPDSINDLSQNYHSLRRENGKFGSHPEEDAYNEESKA